MLVVIIRPKDNHSKTVDLFFFKTCLSQIICHVCDILQLTLPKQGFSFYNKTIRRSLGEGTLPLKALCLLFVFPPQVLACQITVVNMLERLKNNPADGHQGVGGQISEC